jgi:hypothetical protein
VERVVREHDVLTRARLTGLAAALVLVGSGSVLTASATPPSSGSTFVPITSCRLLDTRPGSDNVGSRSTPLRADDTLEVSVRGTSGNCTIPSDATAVSMNVTIVGPTSTSYLTVFPSDASPRPLVSSLNWVAGQAPTANAVTSRLSADGRLSFYNLSGSVDLLADVVGYYTPTAASVTGPRGEIGSTGSTGPTGATGAKGPTGEAARPPQVLHVSASGGDFTSVVDALYAIGTTLPESSATHPYRIEIGPGVYLEDDTLFMKSYVEVVGAGIDLTTIRCSCSSEFQTGGQSVFAAAVSHAALRDLTLESIGALVNIGVVVASTSASDPFEIDHVRIVTKGTSAAVGLWTGGAVHATSVDVDGSFGMYTGVRIELDGVVVMRDSTVTADMYAVDNSQGVADVADSDLLSDAAIRTGASARTFVARTMIETPTVGANHCVDVWDSSYAPTTCS